LHAVLSMNMYSLHGFEARIEPPAGQVCHWLMVVSNWIPGSAHAQAASAMRRHRSRALMVRITLPSVRAVSCQSASSSTARKKA